MKRNVRISYNAPVILTFVFICFLSTLLGLITRNRSTIILFSVYRSSISNPLTYLRLFTHVFGHIGIDHFISNAMFLLMLGPMLEEKYGSKAMTRVIIVTAFITGVSHCLLFGNTSLCGSSGIVFALIVLSSFTTFKDGEIPLSFILVTILFLGKEVYSSIAIRDNISNLTHVIGGIVGGVLGYYLNRKPTLY